MKYKQYQYQKKFGILVKRGPKILFPKYCRQKCPCMVLTMEVTNFENLKGVPKKIWSMFFEAGVKNQKFKVEILIPKNIG